MSEESTTPDLVESTRRAIESVATRDWGVAMGSYGPGSVWDMSQLGLGTYEGVAAIRGVFEDWLNGYEEIEIEVEQLVDLGAGVTFAVVHQDGQLVDSDAHAEIRYASVTEWANNLIVRATSYTDIDEGRAAAERLAEERLAEERRAMSENLDLVRSIYEDWKRGDFSSADWAHRDIEFAFVDGPEPGHWSGLQEMADRYREWLSGWRDFRAEPEEFVVLDATRVLVLVRNSGRGRASGLELEQQSVANLFEVIDGRVAKLVIHWDRERARADLGLTG